MYRATLPDWANPCLRANSSKQANTRSDAGGYVPILKQGKQKLWEKKPIKIGPPKQPMIKKNEDEPISQLSVRKLYKKKVFSEGNIFSNYTYLPPCERRKKIFLVLVEDINSVLKIYHFFTYLQVAMFCWLTSEPWQLASLMLCNHKQWGCHQ